MPSDAFELFGGFLLRAGDRESQSSEMVEERGRRFWVLQLVRGLLGLLDHKAKVTEPSHESREARLLPVDSFGPEFPEESFLGCRAGEQVSDDGERRL